MTMNKKILILLLTMLTTLMFGCSDKEKTASGKTQQSKEFSTLQSEKEIKEKEAKELKSEIEKLKAKKDSLNAALDSLRK